MLILDVRILKDKSDRLIVWRGDDVNAVIESFCLKNSLSVHKKARLVQEIQSNLNELMVIS